MAAREFGPSNDVTNDVPKAPRAMQKESPVPPFTRGRSPPPRNNGWAPPDGPAIMFPMERGQVLFFGFLGSSFTDV